MAANPTAPKTRLRLVSCPCGHKVRVSRKTMAAVQLTCDQGHVLSPVDPADERYLAELWEDAQAAASGGYGRPRGGKRDHRSGWARGTPRCVVCHRYLSAIGAECKSCGYDNGAGRFVERAMAF